MDGRQITQVACRSLCLNEESFNLAEKKHLQGSISTLAVHECSTSPQHHPILLSIPHQHFIQMLQRNVDETQITYLQGFHIKTLACHIWPRSWTRKTLIVHGQDMVANYIYYRARCMNAFLKPVESLLVDQCNIICMVLRGIVWCGFLIKSVRGQYKAILLELRINTTDTNRLITLKWELQQRFGKRISMCWPK